MSTIHFINEFLSRDFFATIEICVFAYFGFCVQRFVLLPKNPEQGMCAATLAPIFDEPDPIPSPQTKPAPTAKQKPTLSTLIRSEVESKGIRQLRADVYRQGMQNAVKEVTGKSPSRCTVAELRMVLG